MSTISRRDLLKSAAAGSAAVAALGMTAPALADEAEPAEGKHSWEVKPDPITDFAETVDCDVLIVGGGYSGCSCACNAAQNGLNTVLVEKDDVLNGHGVGGTGAIKSRVMDENGIVLDKPIEMERWVSTCGNRCSEKVVGKFFRESERCMNWLLDLGEEYGMDCMLTVGSNSTVHPEASCYHMLFGGDFYDKYGYAKAVEYMLADAAEKAGAQIVYNTPAVQLVQDDSGAVTGAICQNADGDYVQYNAAKGVVLATGDVSWNDEYLEEFAPIALQVKSRLCGDLGNVGDGHNMAAWAGAAFQPAPWPTMMHPQAAGMFQGKRFMNEATWVQGKCVGIMVNGHADHAWSIFDSNFEADNTASLEYGGGMFWDSFRAVGTSPADASASHAKTVKEGVESTPDNELCEAGEDTDFYKESHFLFPIKEGPFYAVEVGPGLLGVCGGIQINEDFQALDADNQPIEGLYAIGNCAGGMYAYDYPINIQGNSHGRCLVEGKCLAEQLAGVEE